MLPYGDPAYLLCIHMQAPFRNGVLTLTMQTLNCSMSAARESVEWFLGDIVNYFKFMDFHKNLKISPKLCGENVYCQCFPSQCLY